MYSTLVSDDEIESGIAETNALICSYDYFDSYSIGAYPENLKDLSNNKNNAIMPVYLIDNTQN